MSARYLIVLICVAIASAFAAELSLRGSSSSAVLENATETTIEASPSVMRRLFNVFKSYGDTPLDKRPPQYSRKNQRKHPISEYLSADQMRMKANRHASSVDATDQFDSKWSGFKVYQNLKGVKKEKSE